MAACNKTSAARARKLERQAQALDLRRKGLGYTQIAAQLGIALGTAHGLVKSGLADAEAQIDASARDLKAVELSRLDAMLAGLWEKAKNGGLEAIDRALKIMERRHKLLGLDAPIKVGIGGDPDAPPVETKNTPMLDLTRDELLAIIRTGRR